MDTSADLATLEHWVRAPTTQQRVALRSRMVLLLATGLSAREVARRIGVSETIVVTDAPAILRSAMLTVTENVVVTDTPNLTVPNSSPAVNAGPDRNVEATSAAGASVALSGVATDGDGDPLTLTWSGPCGSAAGASVTLNCALGSHTITFTADDGHRQLHRDRRRRLAQPRAQHRQQGPRSRREFLGGSPVDQHRDRPRA